MVLSETTSTKHANYLCFHKLILATSNRRGKTVCAFLLLGRFECPHKKEKLYAHWWKETAFYMIIVLREKNHAWFELLNKIFQLFNMMWCIPPGQSVYGQAKKGIIYAWIVHRWIRNCWIVYCELAQPIFFSKILQKIRQQNSFQTSFCFFERALCELEALGQYN